MDKLEIKQKLDRLAEYQAQRDLMEIDKRALLEDVKVPDEIQAVVSAGMKKMSEVDGSFSEARKALQEEIDERLAMVFIPEEIRKALFEIDRKRKEIMDDKIERENEFSNEIRIRKEKIQIEVDVATKDVYAAIATRKNEIEVEFSGKSEAVDENIKKLEEEIRSDVKTIGYTVAGEHFRAEYVKGKKSWNPQRLDRYTENHPDIKDCYTVGEPSVAIKRIG